MGRKMSLRIPPPSSSHLSSEKRREQTTCIQALSCQLVAQNWYVWRAITEEPEKYEKLKQMFLMLLKNVHENQLICVLKSKKVKMAFVQTNTCRLKQTRHYITAYLVSYNSQSHQSCATSFGCLSNVCSDAAPEILAGIYVITLASCWRFWSTTLPFLWASKPQHTLWPSAELKDPILDEF